MQICDIIPMNVWIFLNNVSFKHIHKVTVISSSIKSWSWIFLDCSICSIFTSISILLSTSLSRLSSSTSLDRFVVMLVDIIVTRTSFLGSSWRVCLLFLPVPPRPSFFLAVPRTGFTEFLEWSFVTGVGGSQTAGSLGGGGGQTSGSRVGSSQLDIDLDPGPTPCRSWLPP